MILRAASWLREIIGELLAKKRVNKWEEIKEWTEEHRKKRIVGKSSVRQQKDPSDFSPIAQQMRLKVRFS